MKKLRIVIALVVLLCAAVGGFVFYGLWNIKVEQVTDDLYVLSGLGGNTAVLRTNAGSVIVDTMSMPIQGFRIKQLAEKITGQPLALLINTHYHPDHTHGNPGFHEDARIISSRNTLNNLQTFDGDFWEKHFEHLPNEKAANEQLIELGNKKIKLIQMKPSHTDGDLAVHFVDEKALHTGDLVFNGLFPIVDLDAGGSFEGWSEALKDFTPIDFEIVIPGHGSVTDRTGLNRFRVFVDGVASFVRESRVQELNREETLALADTSRAQSLFKGLKEIKVFGFSIDINKQSVLDAVWHEARRIPYQD